jgi:hypothetical protein
MPEMYNLDDTTGNEFKRWLLQVWFVLHPERRVDEQFNILEDNFTPEESVERMLTTFSRSGPADAPVFDVLPQFARLWVNFRSGWAPDNSKIANAIQSQPGYVRDEKPVVILTEPVNVLVMSPELPGKIDALIAQVQGLIDDKQK